MKKFIAIFAIAFVMVACNSAAETPAETVDTTTVIEAPVVDTAAVVADTTAVVAPATEAPAAH